MSRAAGRATGEPGRGVFERRDDDSTREELVRRYMPLAEYLARRFSGRGEPLDDLIQVASLGLLKAIDRFDPERGSQFVTYASPTIVGELKRHFRDNGWMVRVPRSLQETVLRLRGVADRAAQELGRSPTVRELADRAGMSEEDVLEGLEAGHAYAPGSLDQPDEGGTGPEFHFEEETFTLLEGWHDVAQTVRELPSRDRQILYLRFVEELSQSEIAAKVGVSQMQISRILSRTIARLREQVAVDESPR